MSEKKYGVIDDSTDRVPVPGGWLYRTLSGGASSSAVHTAFVPDPDEGELMKATHGKEDGKKEAKLRPGSRVRVTQLAGEDEGLQATGELVYLEDALRFLAKNPDGLEGIEFEDAVYDLEVLGRDGIIVLADKTDEVPQFLLFLNPEGRHPMVYEVRGSHGFWAMFLVELVEEGDSEKDQVRS